MQQVMENVRKVADALTCLMFPAFFGRIGIFARFCKDDYSSISEDIS
jgi:hypothetical protein